MSADDDLWLLLINWQNANGESWLQEYHARAATADEAIDRALGELTSAERVLPMGDGSKLRRLRIGRPHAFTEVAVERQAVPIYARR